MFYFLFTVFVVGAILRVISIHSEAKRLMNVALAETDPILRQLKTEKAIQWANESSPYTRRQLRQAIES